MTRILIWLEGLSLLVLLGVAMPLKYAADLPIAVRIVGAIHGLLFVLLALALYRAALDGTMTRRHAVRTFVLSIVPFGFVPALRPETPR
jgi:integral membrane protein